MTAPAIPIEPAAPTDVEVSYAEPHRAIVGYYRLAAGSTVHDALRLAALDPDFASVDVFGAAVGVFGRVASHAQRLEQGDRVEIYRPLAADPKIARRARAREARKKRIS